MATMKEIKNKVKMFRPTSQEVNLFDPNLNNKSTRLVKFKDDQGNRFKIWIFNDTVKLETTLTTSLLFSINYPDKICLANRKLKDINGIGILFTDNSNDNQVQSCIELLNDDLRSLRFDSNEGMTIYGNSLQLVLDHDRQLLSEIEVCKKLKSLIELNFPDKSNETNHSDLPKDLRQLLLKFETFAITDDFERDELIEGLSTKQRTELIRTIEPKIGKINLFLDSFGGKPLTEGAIGLQFLAELVTELTNNKNKNHS